MSSVVPWGLARLWHAVGAQSLFLTGWVCSCLGWGNGVPCPDSQQPRAVLPGVPGSGLTDRALALGMFVKAGSAACFAHCHVCRT